MLQGGLPFLSMMLHDGHTSKANFCGQCHEAHGNVFPVCDEIHVNFFFIKEEIEVFLSSYLKQVWSYKFLMQNCATKVSLQYFCI